MTDLANSAIVPAATSGKPLTTAEIHFATLAGEASEAPDFSRANLKPGTTWVEISWSAVTKAQKKSVRASRHAPDTKGEKASWYVVGRIDDSTSGKVSLGARVRRMDNVVKA